MRFLENVIGYFNQDQIYFITNCSWLNMFLKRIFLSSDNLRSEGLSSFRGHFHKASVIKEIRLFSDHQRWHFYRQNLKNSGENIYFFLSFFLRNLTDNWNSVIIFKLSFWKFLFFLFNWENLLVFVTRLNLLIRETTSFFYVGPVLNGISSCSQV